MTLTLVQFEKKNEMEVGDFKMRWWTRDEFVQFSVDLARQEARQRECWWKVGKWECERGMSQRTEDKIIDNAWAFWGEQETRHRGEAGVLGVNRFRYRLRGHCFHDGVTPFFEETLYLYPPRLNRAFESFIGRPTCEVVFSNM